MKKTFNIYIGGLQLICEEKAYKALQEYLESISDLFKDDPEILEDIEARLAEQLSKGIHPKHPLVTLEQVEEARKVMGEAKDFEEESLNKNLPRKLYRDLDQGIVGGVFAGIASFYGIKPWTLRWIFFGILIWLHIFVELFFPFFEEGRWFGIYFFILTVYCVLWMVIPEAKHLPQKLELRGWPSTVKKMREVVNVSRKAITSQETKTSFQTFFTSLGEGLERFFKGFKKFFFSSTSGVGSVLRIFFGVLLTLWSFFAMCGTIFFGSVLAFAPEAVFEFFRNVFEAESPHLIGTPAQINLYQSLHLLIQNPSTTGFAVSVMICILVPLIFALIGGISLLRNKNSFHLAPSLLLLVFWMMALAGIGVFGMRLAPIVQEMILRWDAMI